MKLMSLIRPFYSHTKPRIKQKNTALRKITEEFGSLYSWTQFLVTKNRKNSKLSLFHKKKNAI